MEGRGSCARDEQKLLFVIYTHCYTCRLLFNADSSTVLKVAKGTTFFHFPPMSESISTLRGHLKMGS
jgi:hypothetical protein